MTRIAAVSTVRNEVDIIGLTLRHLLAEGVDRILLADGMSTDGTREIIYEVARAYPDIITIYNDQEPFHYQPMWINRLADIAGAEGTDWILPFDADEFWYATEGNTIADALNALDPSILRLQVRAFQHRDPDYREAVYRSMGKVAYRWESGACIANGNHAVYLPSGGQSLVGILDLREWQFRSLEHMAEKCQARVATINPELPYTEGTHQRILAAMSPVELAAEWDRMQAVEVVYDPIPVRTVIV